MDFQSRLSNCFNQLHWHPTTAKLMRFMLTATLFMLMLTCGFGVAVTPMIWGVIGLIAKSTSLHHHARSLMWMISLVPVHATIPPKTQHIVHDTINAVVVPDGLSARKNVHAQRAEIVGILIDFPTATIRSKDNAIKK